MSTSLAALTVSLAFVEAVTGLTGTGPAGNTPT